MENPSPDSTDQNRIRRFWKKRRNRLIIFSSILFLCVLGSLFIYNWMGYIDIRAKYRNCSDTWCLRIYGNVQQEVFIGLSVLQGSNFDRIENYSFYTLNMVGNSYTEILSGVYLMDIFTQLQILGDNATHFRFEAVDMYYSYYLPLNILLTYPSAVIIITELNGDAILSKDEGGEGPLLAAVELAAIQDNSEVQQVFSENKQAFVHNSKFSVKYLHAIHII